MKFHFQFESLNRVALRLLPLVTLAMAQHATAEPGDNHTAFDSFGPFPFYSTFFADTVKGSDLPTGSAVHAYPFKAAFSGPIEYVSVALDPEEGFNASVRVFLATDVGNRPGVRIAEFPMLNVPGNPSFRFAYHNFTNLELDQPTYSLVKGQSYWIGIEPLDRLTSVRWLNTTLPNQVKSYHDDASSLLTGNPITKGFYGGFKISVFEPELPIIISPSVPLVEGENVPGELPVAKLGTLGNIPQAPCRGLLDKTRLPVILGADGKVKLRVGEAAPGLAGTVITKLDEPTGDIVLATLKRQNTAPVVTAANDVVLIGGVQTPPLRIVARTGDAIAGGGGAVIKKFLSLDGGGTSPFFLVQLSGAGVTTKNDSALAAAAGVAPARVLVRDDDLIGAAKVTTIATLVGASDSIGEGRWRGGDGTLGVRLTLSDKSNHLFSIPATATMQSEWTTWAATGTVLGAPIAGAVIKSIGIPGFGPDGVVFPAALTVGTGGVAAGSDNVLIQQTAAGIVVLAREGEAAPDDAGDALEDGKFKTFGNPVYGPSGRIAFHATLTAKANPAGIWWLDGAAPLRLIARVGDAAPPLGKFAKFTNLILPNTAGSVPIFEAKLATQPAAAVSAATSDGIWALNNAGRVALVARNGNYAVIRGAYSTIASMIALATPASSSGAAHGVDADGSVRVTAVLTGFGTKIKKRTQFAVPIPQP